MLFTQARAHGIMLLCWCARIEVYTFKLTLVNWILEPRKIPIHFHRYKKPLRSLMVQNTSLAWTWRQISWQIAMGEVSKQYTAFTMGNLEFVECKCMLFGLCNAPAMFHRLMQNCLRELSLTYCLCYPMNHMNKIFMLCIGLSDLWCV